uniref:transient receptor potential cation channel subfamily A member 1-like n=1 Tax=Styela clava TaxID=7725 RepID=UPI0019394CC4|nr:transient receptor potential cation channel subfamily A member 1-like [Styela clava]
MESRLERGEFFSKNEKSLDRSSSVGVFRLVLDAMTYHRKSDCSSHINNSVSSSALSNITSKPSPSTKRLRWATGRRKQEEMSKSLMTSDAQSGDICRISDGPNYLFMATKNGHLKKIISVCDIQPERLFHRDLKGASLLHHAAAYGRINNMEYILQCPNGVKLLNSLDELDSTPLNWAASRDEAESINLLLSRGCDPMLQNKRGENALHTCVMEKSYSALEAMLVKKNRVDVNQKKKTSGATALHISAEYDDFKSAQMLLAAGAKPCIACNIGYRPLHCAALHGSRGVMELIIQKCEESGYTRDQVLSFNDKEMCSPLHCAVFGGNTDAIKTCLSYGARLDKCQADLSTPMHLVCAQGAFDIVEIMFELARDQALVTLSMKDNQKHTPLHKAAMYGHGRIAQYLVREGAATDIPDAEENTPLLLAASRENWICVRQLIEAGADILLKNKDGRNVLHMIVLQGGDIRHLDAQNIHRNEITEISKTIFMRPEIQELLNQTDADGCTPLHYACQEGNLASLETLMGLGVSARMKSSVDQSPLHFAAMYGRYNTCRKLLNSTQGPNIINDKDQQGMTPLHFASLNGHTKVVELFLNKGAVFHRTNAGQSVLHAASSNGYTKTMRILITMNRTLLDQQDEDGDTALHIAARNSHVNAVRLCLDLGSGIFRNRIGTTAFVETITTKNREVALAMVEHGRWEEGMDAISREKGECILPSLLLIQHLPDVWMAAMNRCIETADCNPKSKKYWIKYQFKYLQPSLKTQETMNDCNSMNKKESIEKKNKKVEKGENASRTFNLPALNKMVDYNRVECLRHPVSMAYMHMKWNAYGRWFHGLNLFVYMLGLFPLTYLVCTMDSAPSKHIDGYGNSSTFDGPFQYSNFQYSMLIILTVLSSCQLIKEIVQMIEQKANYFKDMINMIEWLLYVCSLLYVIPFYTGYPHHWQFDCGALAILFAWLNFLLFLQRFDITGIYVVMFIEIFSTLVKVLAIFSSLIVAFSLAFYVLMCAEDDHHSSFSSVGLSIMRIITMTLGEVNYIEKFVMPYVDDDDNTLHYSVMAMLLLAFFILIMPILLMNLLIGLAVGDIAQVQNTASLRRLAMQVQLHTDIESRLSERMLNAIDKKELIMYPNRTCGSIEKLFGFVSGIPGIENEYGESRTDRNISYLNTEIQKQKVRMKDIQNSMQRQYDMLRLIVQKMEIRSEADDRDEGNNPSSQTRADVNRNRLRMSAIVGAKLATTRTLKSSRQ